MDMRTRDAREREAAVMVPVYGQLPFLPVRAAGCDLISADGRRVLDLYGGHAVAALGYGHPSLTDAIRRQTDSLLFQSNALAMDVRARAAEMLIEVAPDRLTRAFFVNSGAEANENALRIACRVTGRRKILAVTHGFHGRTAAAAAVTWNSAHWYGFPSAPFDVDFIPRDDCEAARQMIDRDTAGVIFEPVQGVAGGYDLSHEFIHALRERTEAVGAILIADEVQTGMGRSGQFFAVQAHAVDPDVLTVAKALGGGFPTGAVLVSEDVSSAFSAGDLGTTFGGGPVAAAAICAVIETIRNENLLANVREREMQIRDRCVLGPVERIRGMGLLLGLHCDRPAKEVRDVLLEHDILTGTSSDPQSLRILAPLVIGPEHVTHLAQALASIPPA